MSFTHQITSQYNSGQRTVNGAVRSFTAAAEANLDVSVAGSTTNQEHDLAFTQSLIQAVCLVSTAAVTVKTNSTGSPQETITLAAGVPLIWAHTDVAACPFAGDLTKVFITNAGSTAAQVTIFVLLAL